MSILAKFSLLRMDSSIRDGMMFSLFSFLNRGLGFFLLLILANYIFPSDYGYLSLFNTVCLVIGYFIAFSTDGYMTVAFFREGKDGLKQTFSCILTTSICVGLFLLLILFVFGNELSKIINLPLKMIYLSVAICFFSLLSNINLDLFRIQGKVKYYGFFSCSNAFFNFVLSVVLVKFFLMGWEGRVWAQFACACVYGVLCLVIFFKGGLICKLNRSYWKSMLIWGIPLIPHLSINFIRQGMDRYIINACHGIEYVGLFSFAMNLSNIIFMVGMGFNQSNSVEIYKTLGDKNLKFEIKKCILKKQRRLLLKVYLVATFLICLVCFLGVPLFLPRYEGSLLFFPFLAVYAFFYCCYLLYTNYLFFFKKTRNIMFVTFGSSVVHLILSILLTRYSLYYTCLIYCVSQFLIVVGIRHLALKTLNNVEVYDEV